MGFVLRDQGNSRLAAVYTEDQSNGFPEPAAPGSRRFFVLWRLTRVRYHGQLGNLPDGAFRQKRYCDRNYGCLVLNG